MIAVITVGVKLASNFSWIDGRSSGVIGSLQCAQMTTCSLFPHEGNSFPAFASHLYRRSCECKMKFPLILTPPEEASLATPHPPAFPDSAVYGSSIPLPAVDHKEPALAGLASSGPIPLRLVPQFGTNLGLVAHCGSATWEYLRWACQDKTLQYAEAWFTVPLLASAKMRQAPSFLLVGVEPVRHVQDFRDLMARARTQSMRLSRKTHQHAFNLTQLEGCVILFRL